MKTIFCITGLAIQGLAMSVQAQTGKPNIVVIMTDQQRADLCGREGFPLEVWIWMSMYSWSVWMKMGSQL